MGQNEEKGAPAPIRELRVGTLLMGIVLLAATAGLAAEHKRAYLRLELLSGGEVEGELLAVKGEKLLLQSAAGIGREIAIREVSRLGIQRRHRVGTGLLRGILGGFALGSLIMLPTTISEYDEYGIMPVAIYGPMFACGGAVIGTIAGIVMGPYKTHRLQGKSEMELAAMLRYLGRKARFPTEEPERISPVPGMIAFTSLSGLRGSARWHLGITPAQVWTGDKASMMGFVKGIRHDPRFAARVTSNAGVSGSTSNGEDGKGLWLGLHQIHLEYDIDRRWTVGVLLAPNPLSQCVSGSGIKKMLIDGQDTEIFWHTEMQNQSFHLTLSCLLLPAGAHLRQDAVRLRAGLGLNGAVLCYSEYSNSNIFSAFSYGANYDDTGGSTSISALAGAEAIHFFNARWSLSLSAGYRYVPVRYPERLSTGTIYRRDSDSEEVVAFTLPRCTLNAGGFHAGISLGFHF